MDRTLEETFTQKRPEASSLDDFFASQTDANIAFVTKPLSLLTAELHLLEAKRKFISECVNTFSGIRNGNEYLHSILSKLPSTTVAGSFTGISHPKTVQDLNITKFSDIYLNHKLNSLLVGPLVSYDCPPLLFQNDQIKRIAGPKETIHATSLEIAAQHQYQLATLEMQRIQTLLNDTLAKKHLTLDSSVQNMDTEIECLSAAKASISPKRCEQRRDKINNKSAAIVQSTELSATGRTEITDSPKTKPTSLKLASFTKGNEAQRDLKTNTLHKHTRLPFHSDPDCVTSRVNIISPPETSKFFGSEKVSLKRKKELSCSDRIDQKHTRLPLHSDHTSMTIHANVICPPESNKSPDEEKVSLKRKKEPSCSDRKLLVKTKKRKRPSDMPRRPLSAYNFFFSEERQRILHSISNGSTDTRDNTFKSDEQSLDQMASLKDALDVQENASDSNTKRLLSLGHIEKPVRRQHRKTHGKIGFKNLVKLIVERWRNLPPTQKVHYQRLASIDSERYSEQLRVYHSKKQGSLENLS